MLLATTHIPTFVHTQITIGHVHLILFSPLKLIMFAEGTNYEASH